MKQFKKVFIFEFLEMMRKKSIRITIVILSIITFGITFMPALANTNIDSESTNEIVTSDETIGLVIEDPSLEDKEIQNIFPVKEVRLYSNAQSLKNDINNKTIDKGFIIKDSTHYESITYDLNMFQADNDQILLKNLLVQITQKNNLEAKGINANDAIEAMNVEINSTYEVLGKNSAQGYFIANAVIMLVYMLIVFFGQSVSTSVAKEKDSRTMELLITSVKPKYLILGKVFALSLVGVIQAAAIVASLFIGLMINKGNYPDMILSILSGTLTWNIGLVFFIFSASGYILYLFLYAALGSLVSKVEDVSSSVTPITFLFIVVFMVAVMGLQIPDSSLIVISSYIPFISLFTMPIRYMLTSISVVELFISMVIMIVTTILIAKLSIYIYRYGSLNYGNKIKLKEIFKSFRNK